ncbi:ATP-binding protein [Streptobacillus ratti]|uniref:ATP-binding protein n=1 Tax=Streptobacillus ratti TaxID=1720557 RepID=UPI000933510A|nr:ATP-binding protein [Streptobacillus ratti]
MQVMKIEKDLTELEIDIRDFFRKEINPDLFTVSKKTLEHKFENWDKNTMQELKKKLERLCSNFKSGNKYGAVFTGDVGTGKTFAVDCIYNELKEKFIVLRTNLSTILEVLKDNFNSNKDVNYSVKRFYKELRYLDILILDDLGSEKKSEWRLEILFNIINICYENRKTLFITTNMDKIELEKHLKFNGTDKALDRILNICYVVEFDEKMRKSLSNW